MMNKKLFTFLLVLAAFAGYNSNAQVTPPATRFDTTGCSRYVYLMYDKFTEEKEAGSYDPVTVVNAEGGPSSPLAPGTYKIEFHNVLMGRQLDRFESWIIMSNLANNTGTLKSQLNGALTIYFIFEDNRKFNIKGSIFQTEGGFKIPLPLQGELMNQYKNKKITAMRISGTSIGNVDFEFEDKHANHLLNELACMFGYK